MWDNRIGYTDMCLSEPSGLLAAVSKRLGLHYCCQYFGIDAIMYERVDLVNFVPENWLVAEQLAVVIEHENVIEGAEQEVNRLSVYNSPLKVLITYPWVKSADRCLKTYADILRRADTFNDFTTHRKHLVIFGFRAGDDVAWKSYFYRMGEFVLLGATS